MKVCALLVLCFVAAASANSGGYGRQAAGGDWNYDEEALGPKNWKTTYPKCDGKKQSPVNIMTRHLKRDKTIGNLTMIGYNVATKIDVTNIDNTVQFVPHGSKPQVKFEGVTYTLEKIHSHWASTIFQGSEHIVDSKQYTGELHFIHWNTKYSSFSDAMDKSDGLLVWSHFLMADSYNTNTNSNLGWVWAAMAWVKNTATRSTYATSAYSLESLLPTKDPAFYQLYTYKGSLTTPPCHESVKWVVNKVPISISETQMNYFKNVRDAKMTVGNQISYAGNNFRRPQSLNDRNVYANFHMHDLTPQLDCWDGKF